MSLFVPAAVERPKRNRKAVPSVISDPTPRGIVEDILADSGDDREFVAASAGEPADALSRARQRRKNAGYSRASA